MKKFTLSYRVYKSVSSNIKKPTDADTAKSQKQRAKCQKSESQKGLECKSGGPMLAGSRFELDNK